jgi:hypothetical protein
MRQASARATLNSNSRDRTVTCLRAIIITCGRRFSTSLRKLTMARFAIVLFLLLSPLTLAQQRDPAKYTKFLVPMSGNLQGVNAQWIASLVMRNEGPLPLDAFPLQTDCFCCSACLGLRSYPAFAPGQDGFGMYAGLPGGFNSVVPSLQGYFLYVETVAAGQFNAHLEVADRLKNPQHSTTLPVVAEGDFLTGRRSIIGVPVTSSRVSVRVYQSSPDSNATIAIRIFEFGPPASANSPAALLSQRDFQFAFDAQTDTCMPVFNCPAAVYHPGYVEIPFLPAVFPEVAENRSFFHLVRLEFEPRSPTEKYWPLVTVTDAATNDVQVFTAR